MASETPDSQSLDSWEEAFQYPIPAVRRVEQELRRDISSNRDKLRSLVGVKYRELLGTAHTIIDMKKEIQKVESNLSEIGRRCNPRLVATESARLEKTKSTASAKSENYRSTAAHLTLLRNCTNSILRIFRKGGSIVVAAKLIVICRQLHYKLSQSGTTPPYLENLKNKLISLRQTLLKRVDSRLATVEISTDRLLDAMSAFCLVTGSSSRDVMRHFYAKREDTIKRQIYQTKPKPSGILLALQLYLKTLRTSSDILFGPIAATLKQLNSQPLLKDPVILKMGQLGIDIIEPWSSPDIMNFTPWIKQSGPSDSDDEKQVKAWSESAFENFLTNSKNILNEQNDFKEVLNLRNQLLRAWFAVLSSTGRSSFHHILEGFQDLTNQRLILLLEDQSKGLVTLGESVLSGINGIRASGWSDDRSSLWDQNLAFLDFSGGGMAFKEEIINRTQGRGPDILRILSTYDEWVRDVNARGSLINAMKKEDWENDIEDDVDEDTIEIINGKLKDDDFDLLRNEHEKSVDQGFKLLQKVFDQASRNTRGPRQAHQAIFLLRIIREIRRKSQNECLSQYQRRFSEEAIPLLNKMIASEVLCQTPARLLNLRPKGASVRCPGRSLWEGKPELPVQPSPLAFTLLRHLVLEMDKLGADLWSETALKELKSQLCESVTSVLGEDSEIDQKSANQSSDESGKAPKGASLNREDKQVDGDIAKENDVQLLFDLLYLRCATASDGHAKISKLDDFDPAIKRLKADLELGEQAEERLVVKSQEYWERTRLLFGLLG